MEQEFEPVSRFFGLWHSIPIRGEHKGLVRFFREGREVLLVAHTSPFMQAIPSARVFRPYEWNGAASHTRIADLQVTLSGKGESCNQICTSKGLSCDKTYFDVINHCKQMEAAFNCPPEKCDNSFGPDQPCYIVPGAPEHLRPGFCLVNSDRNFFNCDGKFEHAQRLCPCLPR